MTGLFDKPLPKAVSPFVLLARMMEDQEFPDHAALAVAVQQRDKLLKLAAKHKFTTTDGQLALLLAGCAINDKQRAVLLSLVTDDDAQALLLALEED